MYKTCSRSGIVPEDHICPYRRHRTKDRSEKADKFRKSTRWTNKSIQIRQRDKYLCQLCIRGLYNTYNLYTYKGVEVHHIIPINEDYDKRLDDDNLISLCQMHHKMADNNEIPREILQKIVSPPGH